MTKRSSSKDNTTEYWASQNLTKAMEVALYYGFTFFKPVVLEKADKDILKGVDSSDIPLHIPHVIPEEEVSLLRQYVVKNPNLLPYNIYRERISGEKKQQRIECCLDIIGTTRPIADATVIKAAYEIVRQEGYQNIEIEINSIGDKDSLNRFNRELGAYFKKHASELHPDCKQIVKKSSLAALICTHEKCLEIKEAAPRSMNYLSEPSRTHFKEVLELLEMSGLCYSLTNTLVDGFNFSAHTIFRIYAQAEEGGERIAVASGARWAGLAKRLGLKKDIPGVSAVVTISKKEIKIKKLPKPQFFFIQMGQEAKMRSLMLIEILRMAEIPVYHSLTKDKLTAQLSNAEYLKVPFVLIMGQKESMERTVLVREMYNRSQETVRIDRIADYLHKLID